MVLVDPSAGTDDDTRAIDWYAPSPDGSLVAFGASDGGSENSTLFVVRTSDGTLLDEAIPNSRAASVAWEPDASGFCYTRYPEGDEYHRTVHEHVLGADWRDDPILWRHADATMWPNVEMSHDGRHLLVAGHLSWKRVDLHVLDRSSGAWRTLLEGVTALNGGWQFAADDRLVGVTTIDAPRGRVVEVDLTRDDLGPSEWRTVVPERDVVLGGLSVDDTGFLLTSTDVNVSRLERVDLDGHITRIGVPDVCAVGSVSVDRATGAAVCVVAGFDLPPALWRIADDEAAPTHPALDRAVVADLDVHRLAYPSLDGTSIPIFVMHRAGETPGPDTPAILSGYGGFAIAETPGWSPMIATWCASGGLYAIAGLRGGLEHGTEWHEAGRRGTKQNVFDDFAAAGDWLVATGRTSRDRLAISGRSNGGLLVGVTVTQRPDLCRAAWSGVPLLDMIRFPDFLIARLWTEEYGDPDVAEEFAWLWAYSPYHHVCEGASYPAVIFTTAEGDSRVDPLHARKMAAMMQWAAADQDARPILLHQEGRAGHGQGKPVGKRADEQADVLAFFSSQLGYWAR